jgi:hypothetical protein
MAGLVPAIHALKPARPNDPDARHKAGMTQKFSASNFKQRPSCSRRNFAPEASSVSLAGAREMERRRALKSIHACRGAGALCETRSPSGAPSRRFSGPAVPAAEPRAALAYPAKIRAVSASSSRTGL